MSRLHRLALILALGLGAGCYRPNIASGGLSCGDAGPCPEGFRCVAGRCYSGDGGPEVATCTDAAPMLSSVCSDPPAAGSACNPVCQTGCSCGRCTVSGSAATCTTVGTKAEGDVCNLSADDCKTGYGCVRDGCGANLGRCRKFCRTSADCAGSGCNTLPGANAISTCEPPQQTCNPVQGAATSGCPDPALACYLEVPSTTCDCPGSKAAGSPCISSPDCAPGLTCIGYSRQASICRTVCASPADCTAPEVCDKSLGGNVGFCATP